MRRSRSVANSSWFRLMCSSSRDPSTSAGCGAYVEDHLPARSRPCRRHPRRAEAGAYRDGVNDELQPSALAVSFRFTQDLKEKLGTGASRSRCGAWRKIRWAIAFRGSPVYVTGRAGRGRWKFVRPNKAGTKYADKSPEQRCARKEGWALLAVPMFFLGGSPAIPLDWACRCWFSLTVARSQDQKASRR
jgi:hypothetical protein